MAINYDNGIVDHAGGFTHPDQLKGAGLSSGVYKMNTPDGGVQNAYFLNCTGTSQGGDQGWILVGRWRKPTQTGMQDNMDSVRAMVDVTTAGDSKWSADWGSMHIKEFRVITYSSSDGSDILGTRACDWIYRVEGSGYPSNNDTRLYNWLANNSSDDPGIDSTVEMENRDINGTKAGQRIYGARDGFGNWTNGSLKSHRVADYSGTTNQIKRTGFMVPTSNMWCVYKKADGSTGSNDMKWSVSSTDTDTGQDTDCDGKVGFDDAQFAHFYNPGTNRGENDNTTVTNHADFCCTVWIR
tara:strand:+ start:569 stop:1459 length:891 start_codon:yes stop_codon:yes gene_type:complete